MSRDAGHRCDQWAAEIDGEVIAEAAGLTVLVALLRQRFGKAPSKRHLDGIQNGYSARDDADAAAAQAAHDDAERSTCQPPHLMA
jgi:hypothetical protein